jgi:hypothetical protein
MLVHYHKTGQQIYHRWTHFVRKYITFVRLIRGRHQICRGRRRRAMFPVTFWNCHDRVNQGLPRTNNAVEGWHRAFQSNVGAHHPSFWSFVDVVKREQSLFRTIVLQLRAGQPPAKRRRKYERLDSSDLSVNMMQPKFLNFLIVLLITLKFLCS